MNLTSKTHNKFVYLGISFCMIMSLLLTTSTEAFAKEHKEYSGEEIFGAIALGQGELAKEFPEIWSDQMYEIANTKENSLHAKSILNRLSEDNPEYLNKLEKAVQTKDYIKVNQLLEKGGDILNESINIQNSKNLDLNGQGTGYCMAFAIVGAVVYQDALAWTREMAWTSDDPIAPAGASDFEQQKIVKNLIDAVN